MKKGKNRRLKLKGWKNSEIWPNRKKYKKLKIREKPQKTPKSKEFKKFESSKIRI